jgi:SAM-dependent methyltransferase
MLRPEALAELQGNEVKARTAESFAYEWEHFGALRDEWRKNFLDYMQPLPESWFAGRLVLDVGAGSGRHAFHAAALGARVVAVDLGRSIDVARRHLPNEVLTVQADAEALPFARESFDIVMSVGVLHHLPRPEPAFQSIVRFARPGGRVQIYLYWVPFRRSHRFVLRWVSAVRRLTTRLPHPLMRALAYPLAALLYVTCVVPYRLMRRWRHLARIADVFPLKTYGDYPFKVLVNDQFDRFAAPLEHRYTAPEVEGWLERAGLEDTAVLPHNGWIGAGRRPYTERSNSASAGAQRG